SSLRSRMFLASAMLAVVCIGIAIFIVNGQVTREADRTLEREIVTTGAQVEQLRNERAQTFTMMARLIADLPKLKAAMDTDDPRTVQDIASGYRTQLKANLILVTNKNGQVLYASGGSPRVGIIAAHQPAVRDALAGHDAASLLPQPNGILQVVSVPVALDQPRREILGTLSAGFLLDDAFAAELKKITGSDLAFGMDGQILASTLPRGANPALAPRLRSAGISRVVIGGDEYDVLPRQLAPPGGTDSAMTGPVALILRSRTEQLQSLGAIHAGLFLTGIFAVLLATALSFTVARTIARPLAAITGVMREVAATGDLTRKIAIRHGSRWDDDDARLLATTFNTLTDSIARFQREMSQKERLTALGRLSTVIAHEVRNPLMIIKASLHSLSRKDVTPAAVHEAVADIDGEVARLNRIVNEVLDFARPIRFDLSPASVNAICRESATAAVASEPGAEIVLDLDPQVTTAMTDPERLRIALVNMLVNARHAVNGHGTAGGGRAAVTLRTRRSGDRVQVSVSDRGVGIAPGDLAQIFDPYFTTKRGGTGLGLPITKNIVEGLGGTIGVTSTPGSGTEILIDLPLDSTQSRPA
ncbi:MAG TPA: ATP-binding protein, partial [Vicinamibacterales bacterium]|nr:ATP-binding protein [Vicinamibacterales bacterium]